jgi:hypothetical protein
MLLRPRVRPSGQAPMPWRARQVGKGRAGSGGALDSATRLGRDYAATASVYVSSMPGTGAEMIEAVPSNLAAATVPGSCLALDPAGSIQLAPLPGRHPSMKPRSPPRLRDFSCRRGSPKLRWARSHGGYVVGKLRGPPSRASAASGQILVGRLPTRYAGLLSSTLVHVEKVRSQLLSLRQSCQITN